MVGEVAHRVQGLPGGARRDHHAPAREQATAEQSGGRLGNDRGLLHAPRADVAAGLLARSGTDHTEAALSQGGDIGAGGRVPPHLLVHRRGQQSGCGSRQGNGGQEVIGAARGESCQQVCCRRGDQQQVGPAGEFNMTHAQLGIGVQQLCVDRSAGQGLQGEGGDELPGTTGHDHPHIGPQLLQLAHQFRGLVGSDAASDAEHNIAIEKMCHCGHRTGTIRLSGGNNTTTSGDLTQRGHCQGG